MNDSNRISLAEYQAALPDRGFTLTLKEFFELRASCIASARRPTRGPGQPLQQSAATVRGPCNGMLTQSGRT